MMIKRRSWMLLLIFFIPFAQAFGSFDLDVIDIQAKRSFDKAIPGSRVDIALILKIESGYHINANKPSEEYLIPTEVKFEPMEKISFGKVIYPEARMVKFDFSDKPLAVYEAETIIFIEIYIANDLPKGQFILTGKLSYQACNDQNCFAPTEESFSIPVEIVDKSEAVQAIHPDIFSGMPGVGEASDQDIDFTADELRAKAILEKGLPYAMIAFFVFGLALNLTPCVYPVIPITVGYFGGQSERRKGVAFVIALFYIIGIAIVFSILGLISGMAGKQWGFLFQNPWFVIAISIIILAMAASMFGAFEIMVPSWLMSRMGSSREGIFGAFIMGLTVGVVIAPCAAGIIIGLVGLVAKLGIIAKGALLFFIMGLGLGLPYLILATFSGLLNKLPRSGIWMTWTRKLFGVVLVGVALYFLLPQAKHIYNQQEFFFGILMMFGGLFLGFLDYHPHYTRGFKIGRGVFGILLIAFGIWTTEQALRSEEPSIRWVKYRNERIEDFLKEGKPLIIDFYADWCAPCKQMDRETFENEGVVEKAKDFTMLKVDCTAPTENIRTIMRQFEVTGMPTFIFINLQGKEVTDLREIGFVESGRFMKKMDDLKMKP